MRFVRIRILQILVYLEVETSEYACKKRFDDRMHHGASKGLFGDKQRYHYEKWFSLERSCSLQGCVNVTSGSGLVQVFKKK